MSGPALSLVPEKTSDFTKALETLNDAFGNPERILTVRIGELKKVGKCPPEILNGKRNFASIVTFCLKVEVLVQDLLDLAEREGCEQLQYDVYSSNVRNCIQRLFELREEKKMRSIVSRGRKGLEEHLKFIKQFRSDCQKMVDSTGDSRDRPKKDESHFEKDSRKSPNQTHSFFKHPKKLLSCRICVSLEIDGVPDLYENHISESIIGCPKFQAMDADTRRTVCMRAKICMKCCDMKVTYDSKHRRECKVSKSNKGVGTCIEHPDCVMHSWLCGYHQDANRNKIEQFSRKYKINPPVNTNVTALPTKSVVDTAKVLKNMKRNLKKRGSNLIPVPEGDPMFILAPLKGITKPVMGFFDCGCSDAVTRHGIPGEQLSGVCINEGPLQCFGVGGTRIEAKQEWILKLKKKDGNYQLVQTLTMDTVCAPMPIVNTSQAVAELKQSDLTNSILQNCRVPSEIGGNVDIILGIRYNNLAPKVIHTLETGLTIYSINLETHDKSINAAIGGPHQSFSSIVNYNGGLSKVSQSLQILYLTLENFKKYGPPSIPVLPLSEKDMQIRQQFISEEFGFCYDTQKNDLDLKDFCFDDELSSEHCEVDSDGQYHAVINSNVTSPQAVSSDGGDQYHVVTAHSCCHHKVAANSHQDVAAHTSCNYIEDENLRDLKFWFKQLEAGTTVDYRCPDCRECVRCKNSDTTDKISLREEIEQKAVEDSVNFDRHNDRILINLSKRGTEEFFLTSNRDIALKVFRKICEKASNNIETKQEIVAAFEKLFQNGHAAYLCDVDESDLSKFMNKPVQHYLPWRLVWKSDSLSTPCRPVFDASTNTRKRPDNSGGGRSLNDLLCKGRVDTLNLLKMVIRFSIGTHAITGDLKQFYCCCQLFPEEMNLVRFLFNPTLDPKAEPKECVFRALIFGLKSASAQTEYMKKKLASEIRQIYPAVALLLDESTYVDDIGESKSSLGEIEKLAANSDKVLGELNVHVKAWSMSGSPPSSSVSDDGVSLLIGGFQ